MFLRAAASNLNLDSVIIIQFDSMWLNSFSFDLENKHVLWNSSVYKLLTMAALLIEFRVIFVRFWASCAI